MKIAHLRAHGINFIIAGADATTGLDSDRDHVLRRVSASARRAGLRVDRAALAYNEGGRLKFYGTADLVRYLAVSRIPAWTRTLEI